MKTVMFFNNKGGVGKTTTIVNLASYLSIKMNKHILLLDLDPQSNSTQAIIPEQSWELFYGKDAKKKTIHDYFEDMIAGEVKLKLFPVPVTGKENNYRVDLIPGHPNLSVIDDSMSKYWNETLGTDKGALRKLNWLNEFKRYYSDYDYIFIDVGPSLGALNRSALLNSDYFITPMASDIFSLLGVKNIAHWIEDWITLYRQALSNFRTRYREENIEAFFRCNNINIDTSITTRFLGYSVQQYSKRKFKDISRPTQAYEKVIVNIDAAIIESLSQFKKEGVSNNDLKLGDIPYVYSIIPLSQTSNTPIFELTYASGLRGNQNSSVEDYVKYIEIIATNFIRNIGV